METANQNKKNFNFLDEIVKENTYYELFPSAKLGLAVILLYTKKKNGLFPNGRFKETAIHQALEEASRLSGNISYEKIPQEHFNNQIMLLQTYFLRYDEDEQLYTLKDYAEQFCQHAEETLRANFNPTQIENICNELSRRLEACKTDKDLQHWLDVSFEVFKPKMKNQVDFLDRQIDASVKEIRETIQLQQDSILSVLKQIDGKLDHIRKQNNELRAAFRELNAINRSLEDFSLKIQDEKLGNQVSETRQFIPDIKYNLNLIDKRLDRIQPKLRQFFGTLNKPLFNAKVERFLRFLLEKSELQTEVQKRTILFPKEIPVQRIYIETPRFTIVERKHDLFPAMASRMVSQPQNPELRAKAYASAKDKLRQQDQIQEWLSRIRDRLNSSEEIKFSDIFNAVVDAQNGNIEIAVKLANALIRQASIDNTVGILTTQDKISCSANNTLSIWEMMIYRKK